MEVMKTNFPMLFPSITTFSQRAFHLTTFRNGGLFLSPLYVRIYCPIPSCPFLELYSTVASFQLCHGCLPLPGSFNFQNPNSHNHQSPSNSLSISVPSSKLQLPSSIPVPSRCLSSRCLSSSFSLPHSPPPPP